MARKSRRNLLTSRSDSKSRRKAKLYVIDYDDDGSWEFKVVLGDGRFKMFKDEDEGYGSMMDYIDHGRSSGYGAVAARSNPGFSLKNPLGIPWWVWLGVGAGALFLFTRSKAQASILPKDAAASALQSQLNAAITAALGYQQGDILNISFPSATSGPVKVVDNKSGKVVLTSIQAPATLLKFVQAGGLNQHYNQDITDPFTSQGWQKATVAV